MLGFFPDRLQQVDLLLSVKQMIDTLRQIYNRVVLLAAAQVHISHTGDLDVAVIGEGGRDRTLVVVEEVLLEVTLQQVVKEVLKNGVVVVLFELCCFSLFSMTPGYQIILLTYLAAAAGSVDVPFSVFTRLMTRSYSGVTIIRIELPFITGLSSWFRFLSNTSRRSWNYLQNQILFTLNSWCVLQLT